MQNGGGSSVWSSEEDMDVCAARTEKEIRRMLKRYQGSVQAGVTPFCPRFLKFVKEMDIDEMTEKIVDSMPYMTRAMFGILQFDDSALDNAASFTHDSLSNKWGVYAGWIIEDDGLSVYTGMSVHSKGIKACHTQGRQVPASVKETKAGLDEGLEFGCVQCCVLRLGKWYPYAGRMEALRAGMTMDELRVSFLVLLRVQGRH